MDSATTRSLVCYISSLQINGSGAYLEKKKSSPFFFFKLWFGKSLLDFFCCIFFFSLCSFTRSKNLKMVQHNMDCCMIIRNNAMCSVLGGSEFAVPKSYAKGKEENYGNIFCCNRYNHRHLVN